MKTIGYARVSTSGQTLDAQLEQLGVAGCDPVFKETMSGARNDRPELMKALATLMEGDVLIHGQTPPRPPASSFSPSWVVLPNSSDP